MIISSAIDLSGAANAGLSVKGTTTLNGDISTNGANITFNGATTLTGNVLLDSGAGAGTIAFLSTLEGTNADTETLGLTAGTGNVDLDNTVGGSTSLGTLTITSAAALTADNTIDAASVTQTAGSGTTQFDGTVTATLGNIAVTSNVITSECTAGYSNGCCRWPGYAECGYRCVDAGLWPGISTVTAQYLSRVQAA